MGGKNITKKNQILFQCLRDKNKKKEGGSEKGGGGENSPISPPLDPRLDRIRMGYSLNDVSQVQSNS